MGPPGVKTDGLETDGGPDDEELRRVSLLTWPVLIEIAPPGEREWAVWRTGCPPLRGILLHHFETPGSSRQVYLRALNPADEVQRLNV